MPAPKDSFTMKALQEAIEKLQRDGLLFNFARGGRVDPNIIYTVHNEAGRTTTRRDIRAEALTPVHTDFPIRILELVKCRRCGEFGCRAH